MQTDKRMRLEKAGMDVAGALERFMGNDALLERFLNKFLSDSNYEKLAAAIDAEDKETALTAAHTLKGVCGNLAMTELFDLLTKQVAAFRADDWEGGKAIMPSIVSAYEQIIDAIKA